MGEFEAQFGHWVLRYRALIILVSLLVVAVAFNGAKNLSFTTDYRVFFSEDNPELLAFEAMENTFSKNDNLLFALAPDNENIFTPENLAIIKELTEKSWQLPYSNRVDSITNYQHTEAVGDDLVVGDLVPEPESLSDEELAKIRNVSINEPFIVHSLSSESAKVAGINVTFQFPGLNQSMEVPETVAAARELAKEIEAKYPKVKIYMTGLVMMNNAFSESSKGDIAFLVPISFAAMLFLLALMVGGVSGTLCTLLVIGFSILAGMGVGAYMGFPVSPPSASAPTIILTICIANCVHVLSSLFHEMQAGMDKRSAIIESLRINLQPVFIASLTTSIGFLAMNFSDVPPFRHLGNFVAIGVFVSFFMSVTFLPALLSLLPVKPKKIKADQDSSMVKLGDFVVNNHKVLFWGMAVVIFTLVMALPRNQLNDVFLHYFDESVEFRTDSDFVTKNMTGLYNVEYTLDSGVSHGVNNPDFIREAEAFTQWLRQQPEVIHVNSITDILKRLNKNIHNDKPEYYILPDNQELAAQYLLLYEMSLPYGLDLNNQLNVDKSSTLLFVRLKTISTTETLGFDQRAQQWVKDNAPHVKSSTGTGSTIMFANIGQRNIRSMLFGTTVALIFISLILILALRSIKIGLISLIPNLVPAAMGFGLWGLLVGEIGLALSVVTTMTLGVVVDDTVHFLSKYLRARNENNLPATDAVRYAFRTVGKALITTSVILVVGFFILATSSFELNAGMGLLTGIVIIFALAADFLFLPPLLIIFEEKKDAALAVSKHNPDTTSA